MLTDLLTDEQVQDGLAFARLRADEKAWPALERLVRKLTEDGITAWQEDTTGERSKKWLRGWRELARGIIPAMDQLASDALTHVAAKKEAETIVRTQSDEGLGSGDLAI